MDVDSVIEQLRTVASQANNEGRAKLLKAFAELQPTLEGPKGLFMRLPSIRFLVPIIKLGQDLNIFASLAQSSPNPLSSRQLAAKAPVSTASPVLVLRITRHLASLFTVTQTGPDAFTANPTTHVLATTGADGAMDMLMAARGEVADTIPAFFKKNGYQDVTDEAHTPFQMAFKTEKTWFQHISDSPGLSQSFYQLMLLLKEGDPWYKVFPFEKEIEGFRPATVLVDVSGGVGQQCVDLIAGFPHLNLKGRLILQDLPEMIGSSVVRYEGVEVQARDLFTEQPVKGARFYYLRQILHNWPDDKCVEILKRLVEAFDDESQILVDDIVLPDQGASALATGYDILMMTFMAARERTALDWNRIFDEAGLKILGTHVYAPISMFAITQVGRK